MKKDIKFIVQGKLMPTNKVMPLRMVNDKKWGPIIVLQLPYTPVKNEKFEIEICVKEKSKK